MGLAERFWAKVNVGSPDECWDWTAALGARGYGAFNADRMRTASRVAWELTHGDPGKLHVLHRCDRRMCCNPAHLFLGTPSDNMRDMHAKGRWTAGDKRGAANPRAKLSDADVRVVRARVARGETRVAVAKAFGVSNQLVSRIVSRGIWSHVA